MRAIMIVGLLIVLLIVGILTMQNMGPGPGDTATETRARDYVDRAEDAAAAVEEKARGLAERLNQSD
jgi:hypothetical protein